MIHECQVNHSFESGSALHPLSTGEKTSFAVFSLLLLMLSTDQGEFYARTEQVPKQFSSPHQLLYGCGKCLLGFASDYDRLGAVYRCRSGKHPEIPAGPISRIIK